MSCNTGVAHGSLGILNLCAPEILFFLKVTLPTRIQQPCFSLIDNILTNDIDKTNNSTYNETSIYCSEVL